MSLEQGVNIVDEALALAVKDLEQKGMPTDEAYIALLIRLRALVSPDVQKVAEMLSEDPEIYSAINDDKNNTTIFIVISRDHKEVEIKKNSKVSIVFTLPDEPGSLFECLKPLKECGLNLTKIQSRPSRKIQWDYNFFVDVLVGAKVSQTIKGLEKIKKIASYFKVLGAY